MQGLVVSLDRGYPLVRTKQGETRAQHSIALVKSVNTRAVIGDIVELFEEPGQDVLQITAIAARSSILVRRELVQSVHAGVGKAREQILAANFDFVVIIQSLGRRALDLEYLERQLVVANASGTETIVLLTKADLAHHLEADIAAAESVATSSQVLCMGIEPDGKRHGDSAVHPGGSNPQSYPEIAGPARNDAVVAQVGGSLVLFAAAQTPEVSLLDTLSPLFRSNRLGVLLGRSGVGKSTLVNLLAGEERQAVGAVRSKDRAGRHTTVARRLVKLPGGGAIIDTPGIRSLGVLGAALGLEKTFPEIWTAAADCAYRDCTHTHEPDCAVRAAVAAGSIAPRRLESYIGLAAEVFD